MLLMIVCSFQLPWLRLRRLGPWPSLGGEGMMRFWGVEIGDWLVHMAFSGLLERVVEASGVGFCVRFVLGF